MVESRKCIKSYIVLLTLICNFLLYNSGVYLLISPINYTDVDKAKSMASMFLEKQKKLQLVDRLFELSSSVNLPSANGNKIRGMTLLILIENYCIIID